MSEREREPTHCSRAKARQIEYKSLSFTLFRLIPFVTCVEGSERPPSKIHDITRELFETNCSDSTDANLRFKLAVNIMEGGSKHYGKELVGQLSELSAVSGFICRNLFTPSFQA